MRQLLLLIYFLWILPFSAQAQSIDMNAAAQTGLFQKKVEPVKKTILDSALFRVYYTYTFQKDPNFPKKRSSTTLLQIGEKWLKFTDYANIRRDSIIDAAAEQGKKGLDIVAPLMGLYKQFEDNIFIDLTKQTQEFESRAAYNTYTYTEPLTNIKWQLQDGDTVISGYACKKATAPYRGRQYVAWYAPEVKLPFGPYVFGGLPGLIFYIADTQNHYQFTLSGLTQRSEKEIIYKEADKKITPLSRDKVRRIDKNYHDNPAAAMRASGMSGKDLDQIKPKPYNPMELE